MPGRGPTIGNFDYTPNPPGDSRLWAQGMDGHNMGVSVDDLTGRALAAMGGAIATTDMGPTNGILAQIFAAISQPILVTNAPDGNGLPGTLAVAGTVQVGNPDGKPIPVKVVSSANQTVSFATVPTVHVDNPTVVPPFPTSMVVTGAVSASITGTTTVAFPVGQVPTVHLDNPPTFPSSMVVTGAVGVTGAVSVTNLPSKQAVTFDPSSAPFATLGPGVVAAGKGMLYGTSCGPQALLAAGAPVAMLVNPKDSGKTLYLDQFSFSGGVDCYLTRGRLATLPTTGLGTLVPITVNTLGAASVPAGKLYAGPTASAVSGMVAEWGTHVKGGTPLNVAVDGRIAIPAGTATVFSAQALGTLTGLGLLVQGAVSPFWWEV
jgi:hypothetical protein